MDMATKIARQLKLVPKATAEVIAKHTEALAPHGLAYEPPPYDEVLELIKEGTIAAVDLLLGDPERKNWRLLADIRDLHKAFYPGVWSNAEKGRGLRGVAEQNEIFRLNYYVKLVRSSLAGTQLEPIGVRWYNSEWDLNAWKSAQREKAEWEAAKASLPAKVRNNNDHIHWVIEEKKLRADFAKEDRRYAKIRKERLANGTLLPKDLKAFDARRAEEAVEREKKLDFKKRWSLASVEERGKIQKAEQARLKRARR
jgi:hypothetical protein